MQEKVFMKAKIEALFRPKIYGTKKSPEIELRPKKKKKGLNRKLVQILVRADRKFSIDENRMAG